MMNFNDGVRQRTEYQGLTGTIAAGTQFPAIITQLDFNESGRVNQSLIVELAPVAGRLLTQVHCDVTMLYVPTQAVHALQNPAMNYAGMTDVLRDLLSSGAPFYDLSAPETTISKAAGIVPTSVGGTKYVNTGILGAYNAAVNFLRLRRFHKAALRTASETTIAPAVVSATVLDRFNAVLDPDDRINGVVEFSTPTLRLPVDGAFIVGTPSASFTTGAGAAARGDAASDDVTSTVITGLNHIANTSIAGFGVKTTGTTLATLRPDLSVTVSGNASAVSLDDFYKAETRDKLFRKFDEIIEANPQYGPEMIEKWVRGLQVDPGKTPWVLDERNATFGKAFISANDSAGVVSDLMRSDMTVSVNLSAIVPRTELGGFIVTIVTVRPDETLADQPHPIMARAWSARNYAADMLETDPEPVTLRDMSPSITAPQESTIMMYAGKNWHLKDYQNYGFNRLVNTSTIEAKTKVWQYELPLSVTPGNVLYPLPLPQYPFAAEFADCATYSISHSMALQTPIVFGPTPVETVAVTTNTFEEV